MAKRGKGARVKGANFERHIAKLLSEKTNYQWERGLGQTRGGGEEIADVYSKERPDIHIEVKRQKRCNPRAALKQALADTLESNKLPIVISKDDRADIIVTMRLEDFLVIFNAYLDTVK